MGAFDSPLRLFNDLPLHSSVLVERINLLARSAYIAKSYPGRIYCIWSDERARIPEFQSAWGELAEEGVDGQVIPGM